MTLLARVHRRRQAGFTMVELIITMMLIGILAIAIIPRFNTGAFDEAGLRDGVKAAAPCPPYRRVEPALRLRHHGL